MPFLSFDVEIRKVICSTNAIESVNARIRKAVRARGHFPNESAALKCVYMALMSLDPTGKGRKRWTMRWKAPLNAFQIAFEGRLTPAANCPLQKLDQPSSGHTPRWLRETKVNGATLIYALKCEHWKVGEREERGIRLGSWSVRH
ncbi:hypothetical protein GCM10018771_67870 [Streptomyces cellulosae]|nr:hypothetical protein GCM10018771_67870 [Streptomyces cellulosae]